jgi:hypothetical protein
MNDGYIISRIFHTLEHSRIKKEEIDSKRFCIKGSGFEYDRARGWWLEQGGMDLC